MKKRAGIFSMIAASLVLCGCSALQSKQGADPSRLEDRIAGMNQKMDELSHRVSVLQFMVDDHQKSIRSIQDSALSRASLPEQTQAPMPPPILKETGAAPAAPAQKQLPVLSESAEAAYNQALAVYKSKNYRESASLFKTIAESYPGHDLADNALYWAGESFYALQEYKTAVETFKSLLQKYPKGSKVPDALLKIGITYLALKDPVNAQSYLTKVIKQHPFTPAAAKADDALKKMKI